MPTMKKSVLLVASMVGSALGTPFCPTMHADFLRRQQGPPWNEATAFTEVTKHTPFIAVDGSEATVTVGNSSLPFHPMNAGTDSSDVHWITHIYVLDQDGGFIAMEALDPSSATIAQMTFTIPAGTTSMIAYEWCNRHGLWESARVDVPTPGTPPATCGVEALPTTLWDSVHYDFELQQSWPPFDSTVPYTESRGAKHTPYLTVNGTEGTVVVGDSTLYHPMDASDDPTVVHWITHIYVLDQSQNIIAMEALDPDGVDTATMTFTIPSNATRLTAYEWCNKHGLWEGPTVSLSDDPTTTTTRSDDDPVSGTPGYQALGGFVSWMPAMLLAAQAYP